MPLPKKGKHSYEALPNDIKSLPFLKVLIGQLYAYKDHLEECISMQELTIKYQQVTINSALATNKKQSALLDRLERLAPTKQYKGIILAIGERQWGTKAR